MPDGSQTITDEKMVAICRLAILLALCLWIFWGQAAYMVHAVGGSSENAHSVVMPVAVALLIYFRRRQLLSSFGEGAFWGIPLIVIGLAAHALAYWPFPYGYAHYIAVVPVIAGVVLLCCGWRTLRLSLPIILMLWLAFPIGSRIHASLIRLPNGYTLRATAVALDMLPGVDASVDGTDLLFARGSHDGVVGLGEANRGARLMFVYAAIGLFVVFSRVRKLGRLLVLAILAIPLVFLCNLFRFFCWSVTTVYGGFGPVSQLPRDVSTVLSLIFAYCLFVMLSEMRLNLFVEDHAFGEPGTLTEGRR